MPTESDRDGPDDDTAGRPGNQATAPKMRAVVRRRYGDSSVLEIADVPTPAVEARTVLVRVVSAALNPLDWHMMTGVPWLVRLQAGLRRPKRPGLGADIAGVVVATGDDVTGFVPGDEVIGFAHGAFAEYVAARPELLAAKPAGATFDQAAGLPVAGVTALQGLRDHGRVQPGQRVLVNGAAGGVGTAAVQIATWMGAEVTGVCSTGNVDMVRSLGAANVVDYTTDDFAATDVRYDVILDNQGNRPPGLFERLLVEGGTYVPVGGPKANRLFGPVGRMIRSYARFAFSSKSVRSFIAKETSDDIAKLAELVDSGHLCTVIDAVESLERAPAAIERLAAGHVRGKLILTP